VIFDPTLDPQKPLALGNPTFASKAPDIDQSGTLIPYEASR
jgi:hypothetical protein